VGKFRGRVGGWEYEFLVRLKLDCEHGKPRESDCLAVMGENPRVRRWCRNENDGGAESGREGLSLKEIYYFGWRLLAEFAGGVIVNGAELLDGEADFLEEVVDVAAAGDNVAIPEGGL
jgi:hypothetical protein